jgi:hypothetical protein
LGSRECHVEALQRNASDTVMWAHNLGAALSTGERVLVGER